MAALDSLPSEQKYPQRGEVWYINDNPSSPNDQHLPRPVVIVSTNSRNKNWDSVIVVPCSTSITNVFAKFHKAIPKGVGGLPKDCHARCDLVSNLPKNCLDFKRGPIGEIPEKFVWEIVRGIRNVVGDKVD